MMARAFIGIALLALAAVLALALAIEGAGRALEREGRDYVLITRGGETLECERVTGAHGHVFYGPCDRVAP